MSTIQLASQLPLQQILSAVKSFKRNGQKISDLVRAQNMGGALALLKQQQAAASQIQRMISRCQENYLSPETAKKVLMIKRQFTEQQKRIAQDLHSARQNKQNTTPNNQHHQQQVQGFDFEVQSRLVRQKGESLNKVSKKIINIHSVMRQTEQLTYQQGEKLDLVSENLQTSKTHVTKANEHLEEANKYSKQHNKCCLWSLILLLVVICVILIIVLVLCFLFSAPSIYQDRYL